MKGRLIQNNLHLKCTILEGIKDHIEAALINLDQSTAFDRVDHGFLELVIETAGFGPDFCKWVSVLYLRLTLAVQINDRLSKSSGVSRSLRQGCPLSPLLLCPGIRAVLSQVKG